MNKMFAILFFLVSQVSYGTTMISISNNMMTAPTEQLGTLELGTFDPFNPAANCATYTSPNTCTPNGRNPVGISLVFNYSVSLDSLMGSSVDLSFNVNNGNGGSVGEVVNLNSPTNIYSLINGSTGSFNINFDLPLFGPNSHYEYGLELAVDVTINP